MPRARRRRPPPRRVLANDGSGSRCTREDVHGRAREESPCRRYAQELKYGARPDDDGLRGRDTRAARCRHDEDGLTEKRVSKKELRQFYRI